MFDAELSVNAVAQGGIASRCRPSLVADSPFETSNGRGASTRSSRAWGSRAVAGDQVFLGHVTYAPGTTVARHSHEHTEQVMLIVDGP